MDEDSRGSIRLARQARELPPTGAFPPASRGFRGRHAYARDRSAPWSWNTNSALAYNTYVDFTDGTTAEFYRREQPQLFFSEDGEMTPLFMTNSAQEKNLAKLYSCPADWRRRGKVCPVAGLLISAEPRERCDAFLKCLLDHMIWILDGLS
jgi:hypothetical protein